MLRTVIIDDEDHIRDSLEKMAEASQVCNHLDMLTTCDPFGVEHQNTDPS